MRVLRDITFLAAGPQVNAVVSREVAKRGPIVHVEGRPMIPEIQHIPSRDSSGDDRWQRLTDDPDIRAVEVIRSNSGVEWEWPVSVSVMEFIREDPLEREIRDAMEAELRVKN